MDENTLNVESLLLQYYIRYVRLKEFSDEIPFHPQSVDIYIDLKDMLRKLYEVDVKSSKKYVIVSSVINLAAHLRNFYWRQHRLNTRIFLIYGEDCTNNHTIFVNDYNRSNISDKISFQRIDEAVKTQLELIKTLCRYIYGVYFIYSVHDFGVVAYDKIQRREDILSIVISKDPYNYQLPAMLFPYNVVLFRPSKYKGEDRSWMVTKDNIYRMYNPRIRSADTLQKYQQLNPGMFSLYLALTGMRHKLRTMYNTTSAVNKLLLAIQQGRILNAYNSDTDFTYKALMLNDKMSWYEFDCRFKAIDLVHQHRIYTSSVESKDMSWLIDLQDKSAIQQINAQYFYNNPLDLESL